MNTFNKRIGFGSKTISNLPWAALMKLNELDMDKAKAILEPFKLNHVLPQLMALLGGDQITLKRGANNKISIEATLVALSDQIDSGNFKFLDGTLVTKSAFSGILCFLNYGSRSYILPAGSKQVDSAWVRWGSAVPLFMSAFKEFRDVKYSEWDLTDPKLQWVVDPRMLEVLRLSGTEVGWDSEALLVIQKQGRTIKSGAKAGTVKHLNSATTITGVDDDEFSALPALVKVLLCQTWVFQPCFYTKFGIYNLLDIDAKPDPLIDTGLFEKPSETSTTGYGWC